MGKALIHYGTPRHSGRYPWGSGDDPEQRNRSFLKYVDDLKKQGMSEVDIAKGLNITTSKLRARKSIAKAEQRKADVAEALRLKDKGYSNVEIGKRMGGINESSVRALLDPAIKERSEITRATANMLKESIEKKQYIDVGAGVERYMGVSRTKLNTAIEMLKEEGYTVHFIRVPQLGTNEKTTMKVLAKPDVPYTEVYANKDKIQMIMDQHSEDGGRTFLGLEPITSVDSKRIYIRYGEGDPSGENGKDKDGVIELRRGVPDISLGNARYAQVRIGVDGTHYLKGMAIYSDDLPKGIDIIYNTNKPLGTPKEKVFKEMKKTQTGDIDPDNPFGASIKSGGQSHYITEKGLKTPGASEMLALKSLGRSYADIAKKMDVSEELVKDCIGLRAVNLVNEEGDWSDKWSKSLSSQMLSKQSPALAQKQLGLTYLSKKEEYDEIMALTNSAVQKRLLGSFADDCDSAAVHLKAVSLPREGWHVILPFPTMKENEIYAPNYKNGDQVVLIRYPHGGIFEIPQLTVNNKHAIAKDTIGHAKDAVGIHPKVAEQLSGADFDGDTVLVIPNPNGLIKTSSPLKGLKDFDPKISYAGYTGMITVDGGVYNKETNKVDYGNHKPITRTKQMKMGDISNLITDMTIRGANTDEIARAVRHSMVVIDSEKHHLNYKQSYIDNGIAELKRKYQGSERSGASTLISKASSEQRVDYREKGKKILNPETGKTKRVYIDPETGKQLYEYTGETYTDAKGKIHKRTIRSTKMAEVDDAFKLSSGTNMETVYASHANKLKALGNEARKSFLNAKPIIVSPSAKKVYESEVSSLNAKLNIALKNAPLERQAQLLANTIVSMQKAANPNMDSDELKKIKGQALTEARSRTNASKVRIDISDKEWEAIQAGAISNNTLMQILNNTNLDKVKALATPRSNNGLTPSKIALAKLRLSSGYTQAEVADSLGVSTSEIAKLI